MKQKLIRCAYELAYKLKQWESMAWRIASETNKWLWLWLDIPEKYCKWWEWLSTPVAMRRGRSWVRLSDTIIKACNSITDEHLDKIIKVYCSFWIEKPVHAMISKHSNKIIFCRKGWKKTVVDLDTLEIIKEYPL